MGLTGWYGSSFFASASFHPVHLVNPVYILRIRSRRKSLDRMNRIDRMVAAERSVLGFMHPVHLVNPV